MTNSTLSSTRCQALRPSRRRPRAWFRLSRHDIRSTLPAALQPIVQNGLLVRGVQQALAPMFMFPALCDVVPWSMDMGDTGTFTRAGLLTPATTPITGADPTASTYGFEQWSMTMDQYGNSVDTNLLQSAISTFPGAAGKFLQDAVNLGENAGESLNILARNRLYAAYRGGNTYAAAASTTSTTLVVADASGFDKVLVNGVPTAVSAGTPKNITVNGTANTVVGCVLATNTLTLGTAISAVIGQAVVAADAPVLLRPNARASAAQIVASDVATFALFRSAVARLRQMHVPGPFVAHIDAITEAELFADADFKQLYQGRADLPQWQNLAIGRFGGIDWVRNTEAETTVNPSAVTVHRPIVLGAGAIIAGPLAGFGTLPELVPGQTGHVEMIPAAPGLSVAWIVRPPQDRLQQVVSQSWSWVGDFSCPSDITERTPDPSRYKRAVIVEHA